MWPSIFLPKIPVSLSHPNEHKSHGQNTVKNKQLPFCWDTYCKNGISTTQERRRGLLLISLLKHAFCWKPSLMFKIYWLCQVTKRTSFRPRQLASSISRTTGCCKKTENIHMINHGFKVSISARHLKKSLYPVPSPPLFPLLWTHKPLKNVSSGLSPALAWFYLQRLYAVLCSKIPSML